MITCRINTLSAWVLVASIVGWSNCLSCNDLIVVNAVVFSMDDASE